jgi:hypothetical protein
MKRILYIFVVGIMLWGTLTAVLFSYAMSVLFSLVVPVSFWQILPVALVAYWIGGYFFGARMWNVIPEIRQKVRRSVEEKSSKNDNSTV